MIRFLRTLLIAFLLSGSFLTPLRAWSWIYVQDPRSWSKYGQGTVEEATLTLEPKGIYMEYNLYLTLSGKGNPFTAEDTLEISYYFNLPDKAIMHDYYLWVGDSMVQARLIDRWSAWQIYESIVKRRWDPSVLYKDWSNYYHLQVYPLKGDESRKVRLTFLLPASWTSRNVLCPMPLDMLTNSLVPLDKLTVLVKENESFVSPSIPSIPECKFVRSYDPRLGSCLRTTIEGSKLGYNQTQISFPTPMKNGLFLGKLDQNGKGLYQMAVLPADFFNLKQPRKMLFLLDFEATNSYYITGSQVYAELKNMLLNSLGEGDYFNIILSGPQPSVLSQDWIPANPESIRQALEKWGPSPVENYSNLKTLLRTGINFSKGKSGTTMVLLSNNCRYGDRDTANMLMNYLKTLGSLPVTHVVDFNEYYSWYYFGNRYFRGNEYFYTMLTRQTRGNFTQFQYWYNNIADVLGQVFYTAGGTVSSYDIHTTLDNGFCFGRYDITDNKNAIFLQKPILQIGSYNGSFPFVLEMAGIFKEEPVSVSKKVSWEEAYNSDTLLEKMWAGNYIREMEQTWTWDNELISNIIDKSVRYRVLSNYTAFIALEPGMDSLFNDNNNNNNNGNGGSTTDGLTNMGDVGKEYTSVQQQILGLLQDSIRTRVYPNPFHDRTKIELTLGNFQMMTRIKMTLSVYDITGKQVAVFKPEELFFNGQLTLDWDGKDSSGTDLPKGIYYLNIRTSTFNQVVRLIKL